MTTTSGSVERKSDQNVNNPQGNLKSNEIIRSKVQKNLLSNVLNNYRNVTYNFTISAVPSDWLESVAGQAPKYRTEEPKFIILKSGGKGTRDFALPESLSKIQQDSVTAEVENDNPILDKFSPVIVKESIEKKLPQQLKLNQGIIEGFNKDSPGRYDMFIDDVEVAGIMTPGTSNGASLATKLSFSVVEPYSINGFIEALHAASIAAGYVTYSSGAFLLTIDFWGYPDDVNVEQLRAVKIEKATKYLLFAFSSVKVELTERGSKYNCTGVMYSDRVLGNPNKLKIPTSAEGKTVKELLENLFSNVSEQTLRSDNESSPGTTQVGDIYEVKFPTVKENGEYEFPDKGNSIGSSEMFDFNTANANQAMIDPSRTNKTKPTPEEVKKDPNPYKFTPDGKVKIQFNPGKNLHECIESVVVNSKYVQNILKSFKPDEYGLISYFIITPEVTNQTSMNPQTKDYYKIYTYIVKEYKIHYTRIPGYASSKFDVSKIVKLIYKEYNYTYTGKNIDVLNFRLDFNNLYFESIPFALANTEMVGARNSAVIDQSSSKIEYKSENLNRIAQSPIPVQPRRTDVTEISSLAGSAGPLTDNAYQILARNLHEAVINAGVSGATGSLEILGDPYFISTTGTNNYKAKVQDGKINVTIDNEVDVTFGEVYIIINFRNPIDVNQFDRKRAPFSGVYIVTNVNSSFKSGVFKQDFKLIRIPAQIPIEDNMIPSDPTSVAVTLPNPNNQIVADTTPAVEGPGLRPDPTQLSIPTVNNPTYNLAGQAVNFVQQGISQLGTVGSVYSLAQSKLTEGIRLASNAINAPLKNLSALKSAGQQLGSAVGSQFSAVQNTLGSLANNSPLGKIVNGLPNTDSLISGFTDKLTGAGQEQLLANLAPTLGINSNNLFGAGKEKLLALKSKAESLSINIPRAATAGIKLDNIPVEKLENIPPIAPPSTAPAPEIPLQDLKGLDIAKAFGVKDLSKLPGGLTPDKINSAISAGAGIGGLLLAGKLKLGTDVNALKDKFGSAAEQAIGALGQAGQAVESSQASLGSVNITSAANLFGSKSSESPLDKLLTPVNQNNLPLPRG